MSFQIGIVPTNTKGKRWLLGWFLPHQEFAKWTSKDVIFFTIYSGHGWLVMHKRTIYNECTFVSDGSDGVNKQKFIITPHTGDKEYNFLSLILDFVISVFS